MKSAHLLFHVASLTLLFSPASADEFLVGMSATFTGDGSALGTQARLGVEVAFEEINHSGQLPAGRKLRLLAREDGYDPEQAAQNVRSFIEEEQVIALIANMGTPTGVVTEPLARELKTPFVAPLTGAMRLRHEPPARYVYHLRPSYQEEIEFLVRWAMRQGIAPEEMAVFTQRDAFGDDIYQSTLGVLGRLGLTARGRIPHVRYARNTENVEMAVADLIGQMKPPRAVIIGAATRPSAKFIRLTHGELPETMFLTASFGADESFADLVRDLSATIIAAQVVPSPNEDYPLLRRFQVALSDYADAAAPTRAALEGYLAAHLLAQALGKTQAPHGREALADALGAGEQLELCPGVIMGLDAGSQPGSRRIWLTRVSGGKLQPLTLDPQEPRACRAAPEPTP